MPRQPRPSKEVSPTDHELKRQRRETEYRQAPDFTSMYSNSVQLRTTPWDIQLTFGEIHSIDEQKIIIETKLSINLSPQHAKALSIALSGQVEAYESNYGEIRYTAPQPSSEEPSA